MDEPTPDNMLLSLRHFLNRILTATLRSLQRSPVAAVFRNLGLRLTHTAPILGIRDITSIWSTAFADERRYVKKHMNAGIPCVPPASGQTICPILIFSFFENLVADKTYDSTHKPQPATPPSEMLESRIDGYTNLVDWTLSGSYDPTTPVLHDAEDPSRHVTKQDAERLISRLAGAFDAGSTVCLHLANDVTYPILVLAILACGCRWTGTNPAYTSHELVHHVKASATKYIIVSIEHLDTVKTAVAASGLNIEIVLFTDILSNGIGAESLDAGSLRTLHDLMQPPSKSRLQKHLKTVGIDDTAALMSTSGTTGLPKMAARSHRAMMLETAAIQDNDEQKQYGVRRLTSTPIFHAFTAPETVVNPLRLGYPTYIMKRFDSTFAQRIHDLNITETAAAPPTLKKLADTPADRHLLQSLKQVFSGGAPLAAADRDRFLRIFNQPPRIVQVWGMTEGGWFTTFKHPETDTTGSVGRPIPGYEVRVLPNHTMALEHGQPVGELLVKGPQLMSHYFGNDAATAQVFTQNGWLETGDVGYVEDGKVYIIDRIKDLIKVHAFQVAPAELEEALLQSPLVRDAGACAAGTGNEEHPALFVVPRDAGVTEGMVKACLAGRLASYKVKYAEVFFVDRMPRSPTGKILRKELRRMVEERG